MAAVVDFAVLAGFAVLTGLAVFTVLTGFAALTGLEGFAALTDFAAPAGFVAWMGLAALAGFAVFAAFDAVTAFTGLTGLTVLVDFAGFFTGWPRHVLRPGDCASMPREHWCAFAKAAHSTGFFRRSKASAGADLLRPCGRALSSVNRGSCRLPCAAQVNRVRMDNHCHGAQ